MSNSVIILSYNPGDWLQACISSAIEQADEVVVLDNGSAAAAVSTIAVSLGARPVRSEINLGFAAGVNLGVKETSGDIVALLNDDAVASGNWLGSAESVLADGSVAAVVPKVLRSGWYREVVATDERHHAPADPRGLGRMIHSVTADGDEVMDRLLGPGVHHVETSFPDGRRWRWTCPGRPFYIPVVGQESVVMIDSEPAPPGATCRLLNKAGGYVRSDGVLGDVGDESPDDGRWDLPSEPFFASGTAMAATRQTFERVGPLAERYFAYYEDGDWSWRARLAGMRIVYDPSSTVEHRHSATAAADPALVARLATRNRALTLVRNAPTRVALAGVRRAAGEMTWRDQGADAAARLAWAVSSRRTLSRGWTLSPQEVWDRWVEVGTDWDRGPFRSGPDS